MNGYNLAEAGRAYVGDAVMKDPALSIILHRILESVSRVNQCAENATRNADRVFGTIPQMAEGLGHAGPKSDGALSAVETALDQLSSAIQRMDDAANRFNAI